ncbi:MAG: sulfatase, partial [Actinomycetota bacterium]|nr:sulfatase [Actinomycetota bacterium]
MPIGHLSTARLVVLAAAVVVTALAAIAAGTRTAPATATAATRAAAQNRPNVIILETDDQTDASLRVMRNVNELLVRQGVRFDNNFASFPLCCPSRATTLTGQYAHNHTVMGNAPPEGGYEKLDHSNTLAVWLQRAGYRTIHVGKYLNGYGQRGTQTQVPPGWSEWNGATSLPYLGFTLNENGTLRTYPANQANYQSDVFARKAADAIRRNGPSDTPFFMWVAFYAPHAGGPADPDDPNVRAADRPRRRGNRRRAGAFRGPSPAERHRDAFANEALPQPPSFNEADVSDKPAAVRNRALLTNAQISALRESYQQRLESLLAVDEAVASVVEALRASGELDNTIIIFTSDNGFMQGEHRIPSGKTVAYEPSARVPLVIRGPGIPRGRHVRDLVMNVDVAPTIVDAANASASRRMDGQSLLPLMRDGLANYGRDVLLETRTYSAIHTDRYVYIEHTTGERELYDLATDPNQLQSRHADAGLASMRTELARRLARLRACAATACRQGPRVALSAA